LSNLGAEIKDENGLVHGAKLLQRLFTRSHYGKVVKKFRTKANGQTICVAPSEHV
jgi:hypothetical protein